MATDVIDIRRRVRICRDMVDVAVATLNAAIDDLPLLPPDPQCCRAQRLRHVESGVVRSTQITAGRDSGHGDAHCGTKGWDDISEGGDVHPVVECTACGHLWAEPAVLHWD